MEFNQKLISAHDPFEYMGMQRVPRASIESTGSRRSIPSCPRVQTYNDDILMQSLFPINQINVRETYEPIQLRDETKFEKLFDDEYEQCNDFSTEQLSGTHMSSSNQTPSCNDCSISLFHYENFSSYEENINVDDILNNETSQNLQPPALAEDQDFAVQSIPEIKPVVSREGLRLMSKKSSSSSAQNGGVRRRKKTEAQVEYLTKLYKRLGGKWDGKVRKEAMAATGLSRIQIYKWFFDRQLQEKSKDEKTRSRSNSFEESTVLHETVEDESVDNEDSQQLFMVEKNAVRQ